MNKVDLKTNKKNVELGYLRDSYYMLSHFATYKAKGAHQAPQSQKNPAYQTFNLEGANN